MISLEPKRSVGRGDPANPGRASRGAKPRRRGLGDGPAPGTDLTADLTPPTDLPQLRSQSHPPSLPHPVLTSPPRLSPPPHLPHLPDLPHPYPYLTSPPSQHLPHLPTYLTSPYADIPLTSPPTSPLLASPRLTGPSESNGAFPSPLLGPTLRGGCVSTSHPPRPRFTSSLTSSPPPSTSPHPLTPSPPTTSSRLLTSP